MDRLKQASAEVDTKLLYKNKWQHSFNLTKPISNKNILIHFFYF